MVAVTKLLTVVLALLVAAGAAQAQSGGYAFDRVRRSGDYMTGALRMVSTAPIRFTTSSTDLTDQIVRISRNGTSTTTSTLVVNAPGGMRVTRATGAGTMLSLQDGVETGGADTSGRWYVYSNGTEADSDVMMGFWDSDEQAYRTFGWDEGYGMFSSASALRTDSTVTGSGVNSTSFLTSGWGGTGSGAVYRFSGGLGAGSSDIALSLRACKSDGTLGTPYTALQMLGPNTTGSSVEMMRWTTTANTSLVEMRCDNYKDSTGHGGVAFDASGNATFHATVQANLVYSSTSAYLDRGGSGSEAALCFAGTVGAGNAHDAIVVRSCDPADGTNTTPWTGLTFLFPNTVGASVEGMRVTSNNVLLPNAINMPKVVTATGTYDVTASDATLRVDASGGSVTINLPAVASSAGRELYLKVTTDPGANTITVDPNASETIDGDATYGALSLQWDACRLWCDGTQWLVN